VLRPRDRSLQESDEARDTSLAACSGASLKEGLVRIEISQTCDHALIQKPCLDHPFAACIISRKPSRSSCKVRIDQHAGEAQVKCEPQVQIQLQEEPLSVPVCIPIGMKPNGILITVDRVQKI